MSFFSHTLSVMYLCYSGISLFPKVNALLDSAVLVTSCCWCYPNQELCSMGVKDMQLSNPNHGGSLSWCLNYKRSAELCWKINKQIEIICVQFLCSLWELGDKICFIFTWICSQLKTLQICKRKKRRNRQSFVWESWNTYRIHIFILILSPLNNGFRARWFIFSGQDGSIQNQPHLRSSVWSPWDAGGRTDSPVLLEHEGCKGRTFSSAVEEDKDYTKLQEEKKKYLLQ